MTNRAVPPPWEPPVMSEGATQRRFREGGPADESASAVGTSRRVLGHAEDPLSDTVGALPCTGALCQPIACNQPNGWRMIQSEIITVVAAV